MVRSCIAACLILGTWLSAAGVARADVPDDVDSFMTQHYGSYRDIVEGKEAWHRAAERSHPESEAADYQVCAQSDVPGNAGADMLLAACTISQSHGDNDGVSSYDLYLLRHDRRGNLVVVNSLLELDDVQDGALRSVSVHQFGSSLYGFVVQVSAGRSGYDVEWQTVYLPWQGKITAVALLDRELSNLGSRACQQKPEICQSLQFEIGVDARLPEQSIYPLQVREQGSEHGQPVSRTYQIPFDAASGSYVLPEAVRREY